jgi:2-polyprenyl-6-methoxyphenol hydroxylase-like FAD-dependent oxidoreductase
MRTTVVGAGPIGLYIAIALARRGLQVSVIDRDPGPSGTGPWLRRGVMQFRHPHSFRQQVLETLMAEMPEVVDALLGAGAIPVVMPDQRDQVAWLRCRREVFERALRAAADAEPGVTLRTGHVDAVLADRGQAVGVRVNAQTVNADLVIDASGRTGRLSRGLRAPAEEVSCGIAYVSRQYRLLPGAEEGPMNSPVGSIAHYPGYMAIVGVHDNRILSALIVRACGDRDLAAVRNQSAFDAAARAIPNLAAWTDPARSRPITPVLPGGELSNRYQGQFDRRGGVPLRGLFFVGDAVCTTNPMFARGVATSLMQARQLIALLDDHRGDVVAVSMALDDWCERQIKPWFADDVYSDAQLQRRWAGHDIDVADVEEAMGRARVDDDLVRDARGGQGREAGEAADIRQLVVLLGGAAAEQLGAAGVFVGAAAQQNICRGGCVCPASGERKARLHAQDNSSVVGRSARFRGVSAAVLALVWAVLVTRSTSWARVGPGGIGGRHPAA